MNNSFGSSGLVRCLEKLCFLPQPNNGSSHVKYRVPEGTNITAGTRPFIIVIMGRKQYDPHTASSYVTQITRLGFTKKQIGDAFSR